MDHKVGGTFSNGNFDCKSFSLNDRFRSAIADGRFKAGGNLLTYVTGLEIAKCGYETVTQFIHQLS